METDVYEPPKSDVEVIDAKPGSLLKAIGIGTVIEVVGTTLVGILIGIAYGFELAAQGLSPEEMQAAMSYIDPGSVYGVSGSVLGTLVSVLAGYVCARIANTTSYRPAYILSGISIALGTLVGLGSYSWWMLIVMGLISFIAVLAGAWLRVRKLRAA